MNRPRQRIPHLAFLFILAASLPRPAAAQLDALRALGSDGSRRPLPVTQAFPYHVAQVSQRQLRITWTVAEEHYLYARAFQFRLAGDFPAAAPVIAELPAGSAKADPFFGDVVVFYGTTHVDLILPPAQDGRPLPGELLIGYQGCAEWGFCYPPQTAGYLLPW